MYDIIIRHATVVDGTGAPAYRADVALKNGKIARIAPEINEPGAVIDAAGLTLTPGFIDSHSHSDEMLLTHPDQIEKIEQGITVTVGGQCGGSLAPSKKTISFNGDENVCRTMGALLTATRDWPLGTNLATFVGHRSLRLAVMGPDNRDPEPHEMQQMLDLLTDALEHGAMGISFGLIYAPSCYAQTEELVEFAKVCAQHGALVAAHIRDERSKVVEATAEFIDILRRSGARGVLSHHKAANQDNWGKVRTTLQMVDDAIAEGVDIFLDAYPYTASHTSLATTLVPKEYHARGAQGLVEVLSDPAQRQAIREADQKRFHDDRNWILVVKCAAYPEYIGLRLPEIAEKRGTDVYDAAFDIIRDSENVCSACFFTMCEDDVEYVLKHPRVMIGTDAAVAGNAAAYHPRLRGTFPRVLGRYVRERNVTALEEMIRKMPSLPATVYGLHGKGRIAEGYDADLCIFDADKIIDRAEYAACHNRAEGLNYVLMNGEIVVENAVYNGKRRGKVLLRK